MKEETMPIKFLPSRKSAPQAQTVFEYLLVLGVTTAIALVGFRTLLPEARVKANEYYNQAAIKIFGPTPKAKIMSEGPSFP